jgi:hypothetical protein
MFWPSCTLCPVQANLLGRPAQTGLPCTSYPVPDVLSRLSCHGCPATVLPLPVVPSPLFCLSGHVLAVLSTLTLSRLPYPAVHPGFPVYSKLSCQSILFSSSSVPTALYLLSCSDRHVLYHLSRTPCPGYPVHAVL